MIISLVLSPKACDQLRLERESDARSEEGIEKLCGSAVSRFGAPVVQNASLTLATHRLFGN